MPISFRFAALATAGTVTAGLLAGPGAAYAADSVTSLTATGMAAALKEVAATSVAAGKDGWRSATSIGGSVSATMFFAVDPAADLALNQVRIGKDSVTEYAAGGKGTYDLLTGPEPRAAVKMMKRPAVRYVFAANPKLALAGYVADGGTSPGGILTDDVNHAGTKTLHDDGSADYGFAPDAETAVTLSVSPAGVVTEADARATGLTFTETFAYGSPHLVAPAPAVTITSAALARGIVYLHMNDVVKSAAGDGATAARRAAHGRTVKVSALRAAVRHAVDRSRPAGVVKVKDIGGGAEVYATNPWTHQTAGYTVKAYGRKVLTHRA